jgi:integrase
MSVFKRPDSPYYQIRFRIAGVKIRRSSETTDFKAARALEDELKADLRRKLRDGRKIYTWDDAVAKCKLEDSKQKSWERTWQDIKVLNEYLSGELLEEITYDALLSMRGLLEQRQRKGHNWKRTVRLWKLSTCNRVLAVASSILTRAASKNWGRMIEEAPEIPLFQLEKTERKWITPEKAVELFHRFPAHTRDMMLMALATGLRRSNVTGLEWSRIDLERACCYVPGYLTKSGEPIPVPLNADALAVLERWKGKHEQWVFVYRGRRITQITTKMWRRECKAVGLPGVTFHTMRHTWASWQTQAGTPPRILQELGGWASLEMPQLYSHLNPGHLAQYAARTLLPSVTESVTPKTKVARKRVSP